MSARSWWWPCWPWDSSLPLRPVISSTAHPSTLGRTIRRVSLLNPETAVASLTALVINTFYQTNGLCYDHCVLDPANAFAIVQGSYCWCSTYVPATTTTGCDQSCPGFLADMCGNSDTNVYGYMALSGKPKGTKGADTSTVSPISASIVQIVSTVTAEGSTQTQTIIYIVRHLLSRYIIYVWREK